MAKEVYRYSFQTSTPMEEVEASLVLALMACESLHGESRMRLEIAHYLDAERRACVIDGSSTAGRHFNQLFVGFLRREFGDDAFRVERTDGREVSASSASS